MSKQNTRATIDANIKQNGQQQITGSILNSVLNTMVTDYAEQEKLTDLERKVDEIIMNSDLESVKVLEAGIFFIDKDYNIGAKLDSDGFVSFNQLTFREL